MTRTRWKLTAGALALGLGGLAAVADMPPKVDKKAAPPAPEAPFACGVAPAVVLPAIPQPAPPAPLTLVPLAETTPAVPIPATVSTPGDLPVLPTLGEPPLAKPQKPAVAAVSGAAAEVAPLPRTGGTKVTELVLPVAAADVFVPVAASAPAAVPALPSLPEAKPQPAPIPPVQQVVPALAPPVQQAVPPALVAQPEPVRSQAVQPQPLPVQPTPAVEPAPVVAAEKKLKVMLHMGDDRPRFEVRDGEEVYLKVICDKVDVKSPSEKGETMSMMKACGRVAFVTPGGDGVCDELTVAPGTGQVIVTGKVTFKYNWGKVETAVSGDRMTFRLGTAPGMAPAGHAPTAIPTSYQR